MDSPPKISSRECLNLLDNNALGIFRQSTSLADNKMEPKQQWGSLQPLQQQPRNNPRKRGRSILLASKFKQKHSIWYSQIVPVDEQPTSADAAGSPNSCCNVTGIDQRETPRCYSNKVLSKGGDEIIDHAAGSESILKNDIEYSNKSCVDGSVPVDSLIEDRENSPITAQGKLQFLENAQSDGDRNSNRNELNSSASVINNMHEINQENVHINCDVFVIHPQTDDFKIEKKDYSVEASFEDNLMVGNHKKRKRVDENASGGNTTDTSNIKKTAVNCDETCKVDSLMADSQEEIYFNSVDTLMGDNQKEMEGNSDDISKIETLMGDSQKEMESHSDDTSKVDTLMGDSQKEMEGNSDYTSKVDTLMVVSLKDMEGNSDDTSKVNTLMGDGQNGMEGNCDETSKVDTLKGDGQKEMEGNIDDTSKVDTLMVVSLKDMEGNSDDASKVDTLMGDSQNEMYGNCDNTAKVDTLMIATQNQVQRKSSATSFIDCLSESLVDTVGEDDDHNESKFVNDILSKDTLMEESGIENRNIDRLTVENDSSVMDDTVFYEHETEEELLGVSASDSKLNSHFYSSGKVYEVCEEEDAFEEEECEEINFSLQSKRTASTPITRQCRINDASGRVSIPSECLGYCCRRQANKDILLLSLRPSGQIVLKGLAYVKCLLGSVRILGYTLRQGEKMPVFAPFPEASLVVQGPDAVTITSDAVKEVAEGHWINFSSQQTEEQQSFACKGSRDSCVVDETFWTKWMSVNGEKCKTAAEKEWSQLKLVLGERAVVLEVSQFSASVLDRVLRLCPGGDWMPLGRFMPAILHSPSTSKPSSFLTVAGQRKMERFKPLYLPLSWRQVVAGLCTYHLLQPRCHKQAGVRVMVIGGRHVGCNTFTRFLINSLLASIPSHSHQSTVALTSSQQERLCNDQHPASTKQVSVCVLDLDPRHSEHSLPGTLSCARYSAPVLGPAHLYGAAHALRRRTSKFPEWRGSHYSAFNKFNFDENPLELPEIIKEFLIGRQDLAEVAEEYLAATAVLVDAHRTQCQGDPLVVNCSSAENFSDFRILLEVMRFVNPTHVVHIEGKINQETNTSPFNCERANEELGRPGRLHCDITCKYTSDTDPHRILPVTDKLSYDYARIPSAVKTPEASMMSDDSRYEVAITSYFSALWPHFSASIESASVQRSVTSSSHNFALHVRNGGVHYSQLLNSINSAGLVALCHIDPKHIKKFKGRYYSVVDIQPRGSVISLDTSSAAPDRASLHCNDPPPKCIMLAAPTLEVPPFTGDRLLRVHGWAVVRGVDSADRNIHLLIPGCSSVLTKINCIVQTDVQLPGKFGWLFYRGCQSRPYESFVEQGPWNLKVKQRTNKK